MKPIKLFQYIPLLRNNHLFARVRGTSIKSNNKVNKFLKIVARPKNYKSVSFSKVGLSAVLLFFGAQTIFSQAKPEFTNPTAAYKISEAEQTSVAEVGVDYKSDIVFSADGTKMFLCNDYYKKIASYNLSTAYDASTATYITEIELSYFVQAISFNSDGSKLYYVSNGYLTEYDLSVPYDLSTVSFSKEILHNKNGPNGIAFSNDGSTLFLLCSPDMGYVTIAEFGLSTAFDIDTASYTGVYTTTEMDAFSFSFSNDGSQLFVTFWGGKIRVYNLATTFDVSTIVYAGAQEDYTMQEETYPYGIAFNADGTKFYINGETKKINEYTITNNIEYAEQSTIMVTDVDANDGNGGAADSGITYALASGGDNALFTIDAATGVLIFNTAPDYEIPSDADTNNSYEITVSATDVDGVTNQNITINVTDVIEKLPEFTNPTAAYMVSSAEHISSSSVGTAYYYGITFSEDGSKLYLSTYDKKVASYSLSTPFDTSTSSFITELSLSHRSMGIVFNNDGTKFYHTGNSDAGVSEYNLSSSYDLSTAVFGQRITPSQGLDYSNINFNTDGTKMYLLEFDSPYILEFNLSTPFDIGTYAYDNTYPFDGEGSPLSFVFSKDGRQLIVLGFDKGLSIHNLSTPFDMSTVVYAGDNKSYKPQEEPNAYSVAFNADGTKFYINGYTKKINEYGMSTIVEFTENSVLAVADVDANDGDGGTADNGITYSLASGGDNTLFTIDTATGELTFQAAPDFETPQDIDANNSYEITLLATDNNGSTSNSITVAIIDVADNLPVFAVLEGQYSIRHTGDSEEFDFSEQDIVPLSHAFNQNGTKMFMLGGMNDDVFEYNLETAYDVSTASYSQSFDVSGQEYFASGLAFNTDGSKMFVVGYNGDAVVEYHLSSNFDVSTAVYAGIGEEFSVASKEPSAMSITFNTDGTKMFITGTINDNVLEYALTTAFDVSTANYTSSLSIVAVDDLPSDVDFSPDGTEMYVLGGRKRSVIKYNLTTPFDITTAVYAGLDEELYVGGEEQYPANVIFIAVNSRMYIIGHGDDSVVEYDVADFVAFDENDTTSVADINANDGDGGIADVGVSYALGTGADNDLFSINAATGALTFNSVPDYEIPIDSNEDNIYNITVTATDDDGSTIKNIGVDVIDVDDEAPEGYSVAIDQDPITEANETNVSFTFANAEVGTTYTYTLSSDGGSANVTSSGTIATATDKITAIDISGLADGTITLTVTLTDASDNEGTAATYTIVKDILDTDNDGIGNIADTDDDNDDTPDELDAFPLDKDEDTDTDNDGIGDNEDTDDDNDDTPDELDAFPLDADEDTDTDNDGIGNNEDTDDDNDDIPDVSDAFPLDADEDTDTDNDGIGNNEDTDDDNDDTPDELDAFPLDADEDTDTDNDGIGNNEDTDDDNDGIPDASDDMPLVYNEILVETVEGSSAEQILIPAQTFTPNGDGNNDSWVVPGIDNYPNNVVRVYNRWGHIVFTAMGYQNNWEGLYKDNREKLPAGSYLYVIDLGNEASPLQGWIFINY